MQCEVLCKSTKKKTKKEKCTQNGQQTEGLPVAEGESALFPMGTSSLPCQIISIMFANEGMGRGRGGGGRKRDGREEENFQLDHTPRMLTLSTHSTLVCPLLLFCFFRTSPLSFSLFLSFSRYACRDRTREGEKRKERVGKEGIGPFVLSPLVLHSSFSS